MNDNYDEINKKNVQIIKTNDDEFIVNEAINELFINNKGIILTLVNKYKYFIKDDTDIINEAYYVIWECAKSFDEKKNIRFATFFYNAYNNAVLKLINDEFTISPYLKKMIKEVNDFIAMYSLEHNQEPTTLEISKALNMKEAKVKEYLLYNEIEKDKDTILDREIIDHESLENKLIKEYESKRFKEIFNRLTEKEKDVLERKYGLNGKTQEDFASIAKTYKQSSENIRLIHNKAIKKLKHYLEA